MELHMNTGSFTDNRWWAETTNLERNFGIEQANSTEETCVIALVKLIFSMKTHGELISKEHKESMVPLSEGTKS